MEGIFSQLSLVSRDKGELGSWKINYIMFIIYIIQISMSFIFEHKKLSINWLTIIYNCLLIECNSPFWCMYRTFNIYGNLNMPSTSSFITFFSKCIQSQTCFHCIAHTFISHCILLLARTLSPSINQVSHWLPFPYLFPASIVLIQWNTSDFYSKFTKIS